MTILFTLIVLPQCREQPRLCAAPLPTVAPPMILSSSPVVLPNPPVTAAWKRWRWCPLGVSCITTRSPSSSVVLGRRWWPTRTTCHALTTRPAVPSSTWHRRLATSRPWPNSALLKPVLNVECQAR